MTMNTNPKGQSRSARDTQCGVVAVWVAVAIIPMMLAMAMALNMGIVSATKTELQSASDSAALAAVRSLDGKSTGITAARSVASLYSEKHNAYGETIEIGSADVTFGHWETVGCSSNCFTAMDPDDSETDLTEINAVKVANGRESARGSAVNFPFGGLFTVKSVNIKSTATAVGGGAGSADCPLPIALAKCKTVDADNEFLCDDGPRRLEFTSDTEDGIGFVNLYDDQASTPNNDANIRVCNPGEIKDNANVANGANFAPVIDAMLGKGSGGGTCKIGSTETFPVVEVDCPGGNPKFTDKGNSAAPVVGFLQAKITEITNQKAEVQACPSSGGSSSGGGSSGGGKDKGGGNSGGGGSTSTYKNTIVIEVSCTPATTAGDPGGDFFNIGAQRTRLVE
jgi:Flp pilus assembly protein TadG